jgi:hypothetical protein
MRTPWILRHPPTSLSTDFSSIGSLGGDDKFSELVPSESEQALEQDAELDLFQRALDTRPEDAQGREVILEECKLMQRKRKDRLAGIVGCAHQLRKDLKEAKTSRRERLQAAKDAKNILRQELDQLRFDQASRLQQLEAEKESIRSQVEGDKESLKQEAEEVRAELDQVKSKYQGKLDSLRIQMTELYDSRTQLQRENALLKQEFKRSSGKDPLGVKLQGTNGTNGTSDLPINLKVKVNQEGCEPEHVTEGSKDAPAPSKRPLINGNTPPTPNQNSLGITGVIPKKLSRLRVLESVKMEVVENGRSTNGKS